MTLRPVETRQSGFSLVEMALAVGIVAFAFVAILGLLAGGFGEFRNGLDSTVCSQISQKVINEAQQTDFTTLITPPQETSVTAEDQNNPQFTFQQTVKFRYFDEQGAEIINKSGNLAQQDLDRVVYQVNVRVRPSAQVPRSVAAPKGSTLAQVTVQIARAPANVKLEVVDKGDKNANLFKSRPGIPIYTYSALIGRNQ